MRTVIRRMGNSQGVLIPKPLLAQAGLEEEAEMSVEDGAIVIRKVAVTPRQGWNEAARVLAARGEDALAWPEFGNVDDSELKW
jgi:antitoxin MazE